MARAFRVSRPAEHLYFHHTCDFLSQPCNVPHNTVGQGKGFSVLLSFCWPLVHVEILAHSVSHHIKSRLFGLTGLSLSSSLLRRYIRTTTLIKTSDSFSEFSVTWCLHLWHQYVRLPAGTSCPPQLSVQGSEHRNMTRAACCFKTVTLSFCSLSPLLAFTFYNLCIC